MEFLQSLDQSLFRLINTSLSNPYFDLFFPAITDMHKTFGFKFIFVPIVFLLLLFFQRVRGFLIFLGLGVSMGLADKIGSFMKHYWLRVRPFEAGIDAIQRSPASGYSFPSNHAVNMFCMAFFIRFFSKRPLGFLHNCVSRGLQPYLQWSSLPTGCVIWSVYWALFRSDRIGCDHASHHQDSSSAKEQKEETSWLKFW